MLGTRHAAGFSPQQGGHPVPGSPMNQRRWVAPSSAPRRRDKRCLYPARLALRRALGAPGSRPRRLYLRGDGTLGADGPGGPPRGYRHDPRRPIPTSGGRNTLRDAGPRDQRPIQALADYGLIYFGEALPEDLTIAGEVRVTLSVQSTRPMPTLSSS
jgi:predicted acyl esterase